MMPETRRKTWGIVLIVLGLVAMPIPVLPGIPLIVAGVAMIGPEHPAVRACRTWLKNRGILPGRVRDEPLPGKGC